MGLLFFLAQVMPTVTATPLPVPIPPFWHGETVAFLLLLLAIVVGVIIGMALNKTGASEFLAKLFSDFTNLLAYLVVLLAFGGIFVLSYVVLYAVNNLETAKYVFAAVLPLLGTWVGAVLAHYFQKENLAAATQSITDLANKVGGADKLQSTPVRNVMIRPDRIETLPDHLLDRRDNEIRLAELISHLRHGIKRDRLPLFKDNKKTGPATRVLHRSSVERFVTQQTFGSDVPALAPPPPSSPVLAADLTLADLMNDSVLGPVVRGSFAIVKGDATLADAKAAMDKASAALGSSGSCYDVFVTDNGTPDETVIGWITNDVINENAKV